MQHGAAASAVFQRSVDCIFDIYPCVLFLVQSGITTVSVRVCACECVCERVSHCAGEAAAARTVVCFGVLARLVRVTYISVPQQRVSGRASAAATCFHWETGFPSHVSRVFGCRGLPPHLA